MLNEETNNLEVNNEAVENTNSLDTPVAPQVDVDDIEILDFDDEEETEDMVAPVPEPTKPVEENIQNISEMTSIPSIEEVLGEEVTPAPVMDMPVVEESPVEEVPAAATPSVDELPSLDELFQTSTVEAPASASVEPEAMDVPQEAPLTNNTMPSIEEMFGTTDVKEEKPVEVPQEEVPFTATPHGVFGVSTQAENTTAPVEEVKESPVEANVAEPVTPEPASVEVPQMSDIFGIGKPQVHVTPKVEEPKVEAVPEMEGTEPVLPTPVTFDEKEEKVVEKLENTDMTLSKEEKKEDLENTILLNKQLNEAKMAIKAEEAKKDPEKKNQKGIAFVIVLFTILLFAVVIIPFIFNYLNK